MKIDDTKMIARATCETAREGMARTIRSEPSESSSSYQDGKVANRRTQRKAKMVAMMLDTGQQLKIDWESSQDLHQVGENNHVFKLSGKPDQVERVIVHRNFLGESCSVVAAKP